MPRYKRNKRKLKIDTHFFILLFLIVLILFGAILFAFKNKEDKNAPANAATLSRKVIGYIAYWDQVRAYQTLQNNPDAFTAISPSWYALDASGNVILQASTVNVDMNIVSFAHSKGILVMPALANYINKVWDGNVVTTVIANPTLTDLHVQNIVTLVTSKGYDGIDLDYEHLKATDRTNFSNFVTKLAAALHAQGKLLSVTVHPKTSEPGGSDKQKAQDWVAIGQVADEVRVMVYDYAWETSPSGPHASITDVNIVLDFAVTKIPRNKVILGAPLYGYDWPSSGTGESFMWKELMDKKTAYNATINWDTTSQTPWFRYTSGSTQHDVWFENAQSTNAKLDSVVSHGIAGIHFWRLGGDDPMTWQIIKNKFQIQTTNSPTTTPIVTPTPTTIAPLPTSTPTPIPTSGSTTVSFYPIADTFVYANYPNNNYGTKSSLEVDSSPLETGYMKFNLQSLAGKTIRTAKLRYRITDGSSSQQYFKQVTDTSWGETTMTYATRPVSGAIITTTLGGATKTWAEIDITPYVATKVGQLFSLAIEPLGADRLGIATKENTSYKPILTISY